MKQSPLAFLFSFSFVELYDDYDDDDDYDYHDYDDDNSFGGRLLRRDSHHIMKYVRWATIGNKHQLLAALPDSNYVVFLFVFVCKSVEVGNNWQQAPAAALLSTRLP